jgi:O-antigen/teichoic acid export membrane protein
MKYKIQNYQYLFSSSFIRIVSTLIVTYIFTNFYSTKEFAIYNMILAATVIISGLATAPQGYFLSNNPNKKNLNSSSLEIINLSITILLILLFFLYTLKNFFFLSVSKTLFFIIAAISFSSTIQFIAQNISRIENNYKQFFIVSIAERIILIVLMFIIFFFNLEISKLLIFYSILYLIFFLKFIIKRQLLNFQFHFYKNKNLLKETAYALSNNAINILISLQALVVISGKMHEFEITNAIVIGILFLNMLSLPLNWIETQIGTIISRIIKTKNKKILNHFIETNFKNTLYLCFLFLIITLSVSRIPGLFDFFFYKYINYKKIIFLFCFLIPVMASNVYLSWFIVCLNKNKYNLYFNILLLVFLTLTFFLINFDLKIFIFYYVLFSILKILIINIGFNYFYKLKFITDIFIIYLLTIINLFIYNFYDEYFNFFIFINVIYLIYFAKNSKLKIY